jgi:HEAT repeat protein
MGHVGESLARGVLLAFWGKAHPVKGRFPRLILVFALVTLALAVGFGLRIRARISEPEYQGRPLSSWLNQMVRSKLVHNPSDHEHAAEAVRQIGSNRVLAELMKLLRTEDTGLRRTVVKWAGKRRLFGVEFTSADVSREYAAAGYEALGIVATAHIPQLSEILTSNPVAHARLSAARSLGFVGMGSKTAVSALLRGAKDENEWVRSDSLWALSRIRPDFDLVASTLIEALDDPFPVARENAAIALGNYGPQARAALPALRRTRGVNRAADTSLLRIEPEAGPAKELQLRKPIVE